MSKSSKLDICRFVWNWMIQIVVWFAILNYIISCISNPQYPSDVKRQNEEIDETAGSKLFLFIVWIIYITNSFCSNTFCYLSHQTQNSTIHNFILEVIKFFG